MKTKKIVALLLAVLMLLSVFAGCASKTTTDADTSKDNQSTTDSQPAPDPFLYVFLLSSHSYLPHRLFCAPIIMEKAKKCKKGTKKRKQKIGR